MIYFRPLEYFRQAHHQDEVANAKFEFHRKKRLARLLLLQKNLQPYITSYQYIAQKPLTIYERTTIKNVNRLNQTLSTIYNKSKSLFLPYHYF